MSGNCGGNVGANSLALVKPSGRTSARYSPALLNLKLVCNGAPTALRFLFEAKTTINWLEPMLVSGNFQWVRLVALSARYQPLRLTPLVLALYSSIQSEKSPSSSASVV